MQIGREERKRLPSRVQIPSSSNPAKLPELTGWVKVVHHYALVHPELLAGRGESEPRKKLADTIFKLVKVISADRNDGLYRL